MCLTCRDCNRAAGAAEQVVAESSRQRGEKVEVRVEGLPSLTAYIKAAGETGLVLSVADRRDLPEHEFNALFGEPSSASASRS